MLSQIRFENNNKFVWARHVINIKKLWQSLGKVRHVIKIKKIIVKFRESLVWGNFALSLCYDMGNYHPIDFNTSHIIVIMLLVGIEPRICNTDFGFKPPRYYNNGCCNWFIELFLN